MSRPQEINILLLGETGVGKSTFINAFANYIMYESLMVAESNPLISIIPSCFTMTNIEIKIGQDECFPPGQSSTNENFVNGQSSTQNPKAYSFSYEDKIINLIDTPGIGNTHGIEQDKKNIDNILQFISKYKEIHGICILLTPNNAYSTLMFRFFIKELLTHLHRSAAQNIDFCFTNSRSTFYRPGDTLPSLRKLLAENPDVEIPLTKRTIYCIDNEPFRYLAAKKKGVYFTEEYRQNCDISWDRAVEETIRLFDYIQTLKPHKVKDTLGLNEARNLIIDLSKPIAEISQNIQVNIAIGEDKKKEIYSLNGSINDLQKKMYIPYYKLEARNIDYPRVVCTSPRCIDVITDEDTGSSKINYKTHCLERYYLKDVSTDTTNNVALKNCSAMDNNGNCKMCGCPWFTHMHITYETFQVLTNKINANVQNQMKIQEDRKRETEKFIQRLNEAIKKLNNEQKIINEASAKFTYFLKQNAIFIYNDALADYLELLIREEKNKIRVGGDNKTLLRLEKMRRDYEEQVKILEDAMNKKGEEQITITPDDIDKLKKELFALEINGKELQDIMEAV